MLTTSYDSFIKKLNKTMNRLEPNWAARLASDPASVKDKIEHLSGTTGLLIFGDQQSGELLNLDGKTQKAAQYLIGNPLIALSMIRYDIRAALYAPIRVLFYENSDQQLLAEYDLPSSQFGQFGNEILAIARKLDKKLENAIIEIDKGEASE